MSRRVNNLPRRSSAILRFLRFFVGDEFSV
jgi:hypothetical protein